MSCIIPARNAEATIARCLEGIGLSERPPVEVIVVDDASTDQTAAVAERCGARVIRIEGGLPVGPARARNIAAARALGDVLVFVDADVVVHRGTIDRLTELLGADDSCGAVFGSYCNNPPGRRLAGRYKNLLHHYNHQRGPSDAGTFWAGCGCVRRIAFEAIGGFDERYQRPSIEDIELGVRLSASGWRIAVAPDALATHLKDWTVAEVWRTDVLRRAVPWTRLLRRMGRVPAQLNLGVRERVAACAVAVAPVALALGAWHPAGLGVAAAAMLLWVAINIAFLTLLARRGGVRLLAVGSLLHMAYYLYSLAVFAAIWLIEARPAARAWGRGNLTGAG